jgi:hypothetical protein
MELYIGRIVDTFGFTSNRRGRGVITYSDDKPDRTEIENWFEFGKPVSGPVGDESWMVMKHNEEYI